MYKILENPKRMTAEEIQTQFKGKWVYLTNCESTEGDRLISGIPRVVADKQAEGVEEGIYKIYKNFEIYGETSSYSLLDFDHLIKTITILPKEGMKE